MSINNSCSLAGEMVKVKPTMWKQSHKLCDFFSLNSISTGHTPDLSVWIKCTNVCTNLNNGFDFCVWLNCAVVFFCFFWPLSCFHCFRCSTCFHYIIWEWFITSIICDMPRDRDMFHLHEYVIAFRPLNVAIYSCWPQTLHLYSYHSW